MELSISWIGVLAAVAVGMAIAWLWYSDWGLLGPTWRQLTGVTQEDSARAGRRPFVVLIASIVGTALAIAAACSVAAEYVERDSIRVDLAVGLVAWAGLSLSTLAQHNGFEQKPARLTVINGSYQLVLFLGMALVIGLLR